MPFKRSEKANIVIEQLIQEKLLNTGFIINENLLFRYRQLYAAQRDSLEFDPFRARKYAALTLMDYKRSLVKNLQEGFLYFIANPAWPDKLKVGMTIDYENRLSTYQTGDPYRAYYIKSAEFVENRRQAEKLILNKFKIDTDVGEWVTYKSHDKLIQYLRSFIDIKPI